MALWAIVPVKPLRRGKSRLAGTLTEDERTQLNQELLEHTLKTLTEVKELDHILVVSRDPHALTIARNYGSKTVQEDGQPLFKYRTHFRATVVAQIHATHGVLVLPADLPLFKNRRCHRVGLIEQRNLPVVVIAPDRHKKGNKCFAHGPCWID
ncbi:MAG: hypothetical protein U0Z26_08050 [Anaerolineales bacterium]